MSFKDMNEELVTDVEHLHPLVHLQPSYDFPHVAQRADLSWRTPEHQEDDTQAFPQEVEVTYEGTCVCIDGS